jgi:8-oxo-dGTP pyrophosphatase MutT (NUDIX family)
MIEIHEALLQLLRRHAARAIDAHEAAMVADALRFVAAEPHCLLRTCAAGHFTGSAWIVDAARTQTLLTHHLKLEKWLQLGGHADGDGDLLAVALREGTEESGLTKLRAVSAEIFDLDRHWIPARKTDPAHWHYDLRFMIEADPAESLVRAENESKELAWVPLSRVKQLNAEESMSRMVRKTMPLVVTAAGTTAGS